MAKTTSVNGQTVVHETSDGTLNTTPDVCLTPTGSSVVPIPYSNTAVSKDTANGSTTVLVDGNPIMLKDSIFSKSAGDEPGIATGVASGTTGGTAQFINYSFDVKVEGRNVCRRLDPMTSNNGNTPSAALMQPNVEAEGLEGKYLLPVALVYTHPDLETKKISQPIFRTPNTVIGPDTHRQETSEYAGALHLSDIPDGDYQLLFDASKMEEDTME